MIRFRLGQSWRREPAHAPADAFGLEVDGLELLPEASEEPLGKAVGGLARAVAQLLKGHRFAQLSLPESHLELLLERRPEGVSLGILDGSGPRRAIVVPLKELREAAAVCASGWITDCRHAGLDPGEVLPRELERLESRRVEPLRTRAQTGYGYLSPAGQGSAGFQLNDDGDRLLDFSAREGPCLGSLMVAGAVELPEGENASPPAPTASVFLELLRAVRRAEEALPPLGSDLLSAAPGPGGAPPAALWRAKAVFEVGLELCFAITHRNPAQARNAYLQELEERCRRGLGRLRSAEPPARGGVARSRRKAARGTHAPLSRAGRVRKLRFEERWAQAFPKLGPGATLAPSSAGPAAISGHYAVGLDIDGRPRFEREGSRGVAVDGRGVGLVAHDDRIFGFRDGGPLAHWFRSYDGMELNPSPLLCPDVWVTTSGPKAGLAVEPLTGKELWRVMPGSCQAAWFALQEHRLLIVTDAGQLFGLDGATGLLRYRTQSPIPFLGPAVGMGPKMLGLVSEGSRSAVIALDAHSGELAWALELALSRPTLPAVAGKWIYCAGQADGATVIVAIQEDGQLRWKRPVEGQAGRCALLPVPDGVVAAFPDGACVKVDSEGQVQWRVGSAGVELDRSIAPLLMRKVLLVPGPTLRAVDPVGGQVLAEIAAGPELRAVAVDAALNLFTLGGGGALRRLELTTHLAVV